ncbi:hypothetical protein [Nocardia tenerifensis]|uniref:hypothetical protein n=1 Tax=Nocardia tenerifensis TaxID=228006 RepID=UPI0011B79E45|nr:hypothetical protein [Nocardia tenerifensis]
MNTRVRRLSAGVAGLVATAAVATVFLAPQAGACDWSAGSTGQNLKVCGGVPTTSRDAYYVNGVYTFMVDFPDPAHHRYDRPVTLLATYDPDAPIDPVLHPDRVTLVGSVTTSPGTTSASIQWTPVKPGYYDFLAEDGDGVRYGPIDVLALPAPAGTGSVNSVPGLRIK